MASPNWSDLVFDGALDVIATNCTRVDICGTEPTTYAEATSTYTLANYTLTAGDGLGDWVIANGDTSGRKLTMNQQTGNTATGTGNGNFLAFTDGSSVLYGVIDGDGGSVAVGVAVDISAVDVLEIRDPS